MVGGAAKTVTQYLDGGATLAIAQTAALISAASTRRKLIMPIRWLQAFIAGFVSTMAFHQGLLALLHRLGISPRAAFDMTPVPPLGMPSVISLAFWGGLWGIALWALIRNQSGFAFLAWAVVLGAVLPSIVALFVVFPLKGLPMGGGYDPKLILGALLLNGAWGLGVAWLMRLMAQAR